MHDLPRANVNCVNEVAIEQRRTSAILIWSEAESAKYPIMLKLRHPDRFFLRLGRRVRELRKENGYSQEDMIAYGFSARHWQQIEAGRPITVSTLLRICAIFTISADRLIEGLDKGIYDS
jgi:DNA-binding XRE family transcriptional regulator